MHENLTTDRTTVINDQGDIAYTISRAYTGLIDQTREKEVEVSNARAEYLQFHLSALAISQLNVQVR